VLSDPCTTKASTDYWFLMLIPRASNLMQRYMGNFRSTNVSWLYAFEIIFSFYM
jgi:hypothetical protein